MSTISTIRSHADAATDPRREEGWPGHLPDGSRKVGPDTSLLKVSVFGLGYVGSVTSACLARKGHHVWGVDLDERKVSAINQGRTPLFEPGLQEAISESTRLGRIRAGDQLEEALLATDASIICVGTPSLKDGGLDLRFIHSVANTIAEALRKHDKAHKLLFRSTMLPGTTDMLVREYFIDLVKSGKVEIYYCPEFLREGTAIADFGDPSLEVLGTVDGGPPASEELRTLLGRNPTVVDWRAAELVKYACNFFHAIKVSFANEIGRVGDFMGIDSAKVMGLLCDDDRLNISRYYMRPGNPFGGSCLPKDVKALARFARANNIAVPILENTIASNFFQQEHLYQKVEATGKKTVAILGLTFKSDTDDIRESSMIWLAESLLGHGFDVRIYEPLLQGDGGLSLEAHYPHLAALRVDSLEDALSGDASVVAFRKAAPVEDIISGLADAQPVIDVNGWPELKAACNGNYSGICW